MIHHFRVQNFKSLIDVSVTLSPVTVLVGKSGTGKSNFVQAVRFLRDILSHQWPGGNNPEPWERLLPAADPESTMQFEIEFSIAGMKEQLTYTIGFSSRQGSLIEERLDQGSKCIFHQATKDEQGGPVPRWLEEPDLVRIPAPGAIALGRIPAISEVVIAFTALTSGIGCYSFSDNVLCGSNSQGLTAGLDDEAQNYLHVLKDIASNLQDLTIRKSIVSSLQRVNPSVSSAELNDIQNPQHVVIGHKVNGKTLSLQLSQESNGFRRFYAHLLALYQRPAKQTLLFEHPEHAIHPGVLSLLAEEFQAAPREGRGQVILTTHSPEFLDHFDAEQIRVVELDGLKTRIGDVADEQKEAIQEKLLDAGELLTVDPARIHLEAAGA